MKLGYFFWYMWISNLPMENGIGIRSIWTLEVSPCFLIGKPESSKGYKKNYKLDFDADFFCSTYWWLEYPNLISDFSVHGKWAVLNDA